MEMHCCFRFIVLFGFITGAREHDGPNYARSSRTSLEGASAPPSWFFVARGLPEGEYNVRATVWQ